MEIQHLKQKTLKTEDVKNTESIILDSENIYYNDKEEVLKDINKIVDDKTVFKFSELFLEIGNINQRLCNIEKNLLECNNKQIEYFDRKEIPKRNIDLKNEIISEIIKTIDNIIIEKVKSFIEGMSNNNSPENKPFKKSFFSCSSSKK